jgi:hypothetical protein
MVIQTLLRHYFCGLHEQRVLAELVLAAGACRSPRRLGASSGARARAARSRAAQLSPSQQHKVAAWLKHSSASA